MKLEDYFKYYIQGSDHYLIPKDEFEELFNEMNNWREESKRYKELGFKHLNEQNMKLEDRIEKAIDLLYCYGDVLNIKFQEEMMKILKED